VPELFVNAPGLPDIAGSSERTAHVRPVDVLSQIHQRQKRAQNARLQVIGQVQSAGGYTRQSLAVIRNELHDLFLPFVRRVPQRGFPAHLRAPRFERKRKVQHTELLLGECRWRFVLASRNLAGGTHLRRRID